jgi:hypothetical protein
MVASGVKRRAAGRSGLAPRSSGREQGGRVLGPLAARRREIGLRCEPGFDDDQFSAVRCRMASSRASTAGSATNASTKIFAKLKKARQIIEERRIDYNTNRPHRALTGSHQLSSQHASIRDKTDVPPLKLSQSELGFSNYDPLTGRGEFHEGIEVFGSPDCVRFEAG